MADTKQDDAAVTPDAPKEPEKAPVSLPGGWGGATSYVPSEEERAEMLRIHAEVEARDGKSIR